MPLVDFFPPEGVGLEAPSGQGLGLSASFAPPFCVLTVPRASAPEADQGQVKGEDEAQVGLLLGFQIDTPVQG